MSISVAVDPVTFNVARVLTAVVLGGIGGFVALLVGEKLEISKGLLKPLIGVVALGAGLGAFLAAWASIQLSLVLGIGMMIVGASLAFAKDATKKSVARLGGGLVLLVTGTAWLAWNCYLMFS